MIEEKSRAEKKKDATKLQRLGEQLAQLPEEAIGKIGLPQELVEAVEFLKTIRRHGARRRQVQLIGALMRKLDAGSIQELLEYFESGERSRAGDQKQIEQWRDQLIAGDTTAVDDILERFPDADRQHLNQLIRNSRKEIAAGTPPRSSRALFRYLKEIAPSEVLSEVVPRQDPVDAS